MPINEQIIDFATDINNPLTWFGSPDIYVNIKTNDHTNANAYGKVQMYLDKNVGKTWLRVNLSVHNFNFTQGQGIRVLLQGQSQFIMDFVSYSNPNGDRFFFDGTDSTWSYFLVNRPIFGCFNYYPNPLPMADSLNNFYKLYYFISAQEKPVGENGTNFAKTYGLLTNNSDDQDTYPLNDLYLENEGIFMNQTFYNCWSLTNATYDSHRSYPMRVSSYQVVGNQFQVVMDKTAPMTNYVLFQIGENTAGSPSLILSQFNPQSIQPWGATNVLISYPAESRSVIYNITSKTQGFSNNEGYIHLELSTGGLTTLQLAQSVYEITQPLADPPLPPNMPSQLEYNQVRVKRKSGSGIMQINELRIWEYNRNNLQTSYIDTITDDNGIIATDLFKDDILKQYRTTYNAEITTPQELAILQGDTIVDANNIVSLENDGVKYQKGAGGKLSFYTHYDTAGGSNIVNIQKQFIKGFVAHFTTNSTTAPFFTIYTKPSANSGDNMGSFYKSRYVLTKSQSEEFIYSNTLYDWNDILIVSSQISPAEQPTDEILYVVLSSNSTDATSWDLTLSGADMVMEYVGDNITELTINYRFPHNLAITQNAVLYSTFNQAGLCFQFLKDNVLVYETAEITGQPSGVNYKFNLIPANLFTGTIDAPLVINEELPYYPDWTISVIGDLDIPAIKTEWETTSTAIYGMTFSPEEKITTRIGMYENQLKRFSHVKLSDALAIALETRILENGLSVKVAMYARQGLGFGLSITQAVVYGMDRSRRLNKRVKKVWATGEKS